MFPRLLKPQKSQSFFLLGPRGTGKTSWIKQNFKEAKVFDLLNSENYQTFLASPARLETQLEKHDPKRWVVLDEIQRVPELLNEVHRLIEEKQYRFVLTGSSARKLRRQGVNLLAGRALTTWMFPLVCEELGSAFNLKRSLQYGHLPLAITSENPSSFLKSYIMTYLREEVQQEGLVRNLGSFARFLEAASFSQAQMLNISNVARDCQVERKVVEDYFSVLEDLHIAFRLPVFSRKAKRKLIKQQKFFYFDCGVYQAIRPKGPLDSANEITGTALETLVVQEIRAYNSYKELGYELYFWHTSDHKLEVDLVCYGKCGLKAFEIKSSSRVRKEDLFSLREFLKDYPMANAYFLYGGNRSYEEYGIKILPVSETLPKLAELLGTEPVFVN